MLGLNKMLMIYFGGYHKTVKFTNKEYVVNNPKKKKIRIGDWVIVHPTETSQPREPFAAVIISKQINWVDGECAELCTFVPGRYSAVINDYLFNRLELYKR